MTGMQDLKKKKKGPRLGIVTVYRIESSDFTMSREMS